MKSWPRPDVPELPGTGAPPRVHDSAARDLVTLDADGTARLYVCGITPYDATHLGHAATYVTFDLLNRALLDSGRDVTYAQNVTDVDDPLLERAARDGVDWRDLAAQEIQLFRDDMTALRVLPPESYIGVVERVPRIGASVVALLASGAAYRVSNAGQPGVDAATDDIYLDVQAQPKFGAVSGWSRDEMLAVYADRGGDPDRPGKRTPSTRCCGARYARANPAGPSTVCRRGGPGGTSSARASVSTNWARVSTCRAAGSTSCSRTTR